MQLYQGYLWSVGEKYFPVREQLKVTQHLWEHICIKHSTINQIPAWIYQFKRNEC